MFIEEKELYEVEVNGEWVREIQVSMERGVEEYEIAQVGDDAGLDRTNVYQPRH